MSEPDENSITFRHSDFAKFSNGEWGSAVLMLPDVDDYELSLEGLGFSKLSTWMAAESDEEWDDDEGGIRLYQRDNGIEPEFIAIVEYAPFDRSFDVLIPTITDLMEFWRLYAPMFVEARKARALEKIGIIAQRKFMIEHGHSWDEKCRACDHGFRYQHKATDEEKAESKKRRDERNKLLSDIREVVKMHNSFLVGDGK